MSESAYKVETTSRLVQWKIDNLSSCAYRKSYPFAMGLWNWHLAVLEKNKQLFVKLYPEASAMTSEQPPIASFSIKIVSSMAPNRRTIAHPVVRDKQLKNSDDFVWKVEDVFAMRFVVDVEFLDLKISNPDEEEMISIWTARDVSDHSQSAALSSLSQMLADDILTDIAVTTDGGGSVRAHRAVLAARSPVFRGMFSHDLKEKSLSAVHIPDMSSDACRAFLSYLYGDFRAEEFAAHRLSLLRAADKYDVADLKEACGESLQEDIDTENVLERLQAAHLYGLPELKGGCLRYLVKFGRMTEIRDDFHQFLLSAERELATEIFYEVLANYQGF